MNAIHFIASSPWPFQEQLPHPLTAPAEAVEQLAEHPTVRLPIWVSDQYIHIPTSGLPPTVGATGNTHEARLQGQGSLSDLRERGMRSQRPASSCPFHQGKGSQVCFEACPASPESPYTW